jgi:hypothetical protein
MNNILTAISTVAELLILWIVWQEYRIDRGKAEIHVGWPKARWLLMFGLSLGPIVAVIYARHVPQKSVQTLPEFDANKDEPMQVAYGMDASSCYMTVHGPVFASRRSGYKLAIGCFIYNGQQDILDAPYLQVSNLYDIKDGDETIKAFFADYFLNYFHQVKAFGISIALLNVPNGVQPSQFSTLRQARALGVLIPDLRNGTVGPNTTQ